MANLRDSLQLYVLDENNEQQNLSAEFIKQWGYNDKFIWNKHLLEAAFPDPSKRDPWVLPLIYGSADQASTSLSTPVCNVNSLLMARQKSASMAGPSL